MSTHTYAGEFVNPVGSWRVNCRPSEADPEVDEYFIEVFVKETVTIDGNSGDFLYWRPHTNGMTFECQEGADEWIEGVEQSFEEDYDDYLEENRFEIAQMERYEQWRNEY